MPTFLVTGGAGFFGGILRQRLLDSGASVVSVDRQLAYDVGLMFWLSRNRFSGS